MNEFFQKTTRFTYRHARILIIFLLIFGSFLLFFNSKTFQNHALFPGINSKKPPTTLVDFEKVMTCKDGTKISFLFCEHGRGYLKNRKHLIFYFHPTGHNLLTKDCRQLPKSCSAMAQEASLLLGRSICVPDYPKHGHSTGDIGQEQDLWKYIDELVAEKIAAGYKNIIFYGHSLGTAVAIAMAVKYQHQANVRLVLCSGFTTLKDVIRPYSWLMAWLCRYTFDNLARIRQVKIPTLILHGDKDTFIPLEHSKKLETACKGRTMFCIFDGTHKEIPISKINKAVRAWLDKPYIRKNALMHVLAS